MSTPSTPSNSSGGQSASGVGKPVVLKPAAHRWILVVEDDEDLRGLIAEDLKRQSFRVIDAATVSDAIQKIKNQKFDCIVLDLKIEQRAGEEVIEFLHGGSERLNRSTPILIVSGFVDVGRVKRLSTHVSGVLVKPFDRKTLVQKIQVLIERVSAAAAAGPPATPTPAAAAK